MYDDFFVDMNINPQTGIVGGREYMRFNGFPYIGKKYLDAPVRVLFIPLDTGKDECFEKNTYHSFDSRVGNVDVFPDYNPHIAGVYATALYILKERMGWEEAWRHLCLYNQCKTMTAVKLASEGLPDDVMSYVAYENRFRFVHVGRGSEKDERKGDKDRFWIDAQCESQMLWDEIEVFAPDIIIFQGKTGLWNCRVGDLKKRYRVATALHPSCWQRGGDRLQYIVDVIAPQLGLQ